MAFKALKHLVQDWMRAAIDESVRDQRADEVLMNTHRWLCSPSSLLYDPALHRFVQLQMKKVWLQLLAEVRSLGARVVYASFTRITIATDKASVADAKAYLDFLLGSIIQKQIFYYVRLTPQRFWSTLLFLDGVNYGGIGHLTREEADAEAEARRGEAAAAAAAEAEAARTRRPSRRRRRPPPRPSRRAAEEAAEEARAPPFAAQDDRRVEHRLPPAAGDPADVPPDGRPLHRRAVEQGDRRRDGRRPRGAARRGGRGAVEAFFDDFFNQRVFEAVEQIRRSVASTGDAERLAVREGTATEQVAADTFPLLPGSHLQLANPALEFAKTICHLASLEPAVESQLLRLRRNVLRQLGVKEFATEGVWQNPSLSFVLPEVVCEYCGHCRDLDVCRDGAWVCHECTNPYDHEAIEARLVALAKRRSLAFQLQDVQCAKCRQVQTKNLAPFCAKCAGPFALRVTQESFESGMRTFANIASTRCRSSPRQPPSSSA